MRLPASAPSTPGRLPHPSRPSRPRPRQPVVRHPSRPRRPPRRPRVCFPGARGTTRPRGDRTAGLAHQPHLHPLQTRGCTHPRQSRSYQPSPSLRHLIQIRNPACTAPGCRRPATRCDLDHVTPYHHGGKTCECNLGPACRHDHQPSKPPAGPSPPPAPAPSPGPPPATAPTPLPPPSTGNEPPWDEALGLRPSAQPMGFLVQFAGSVPSSRSCLNRLVTPVVGWRPNSRMSTERPSAWTAHTSFLGKPPVLDRFTSTW